MKVENTGTLPQLHAVGTSWLSKGHFPESHHGLWDNLHLLRLLGCGLGMMYLPGIVIISYYFDKRRVLASGLATAGSGLGNIALPPLINQLIEIYGWRQSCFILAGIGRL